MKNAFSVNRSSSSKDMAMILLVSSSKDPASSNIKKKILEHYPFESTDQIFHNNPVFSAEINRKEVRLVTIAEESVNAQYLPDYFESLSLILFVSRHSSQSGKPTLSVHTPGNLGSAELGGMPRNVSVSPAVAMRNALNALQRYKEEKCLDYDVSYECTHHGPSLNVPAMFVELGSSIEQWRDMKAAEAVAHAAVEVISRYDLTQHHAALGVGGPHYNRRFTGMAIGGEAIFGHMIPKYALHYIDAEIINQCVKKTLEKVTRAILDWKGIQSENKPKLLDILQNIGLPYQKV
jgi:D-aminoacyl-tRNA deacylase